MGIDKAASSTSSGSMSRQRSSRGLTFLAVFAWAFSALLFASAWLDDQALRKQALAVTAGHATLASKVMALNDWVYRNQGFAQNQSYFLWKALGPTPNQVMASGGDCADKSRLLSAMLEQIGISSSLAMQYPCPGCPPVHTVLYVRTEDAVSSVDPVYDITFPNGHGGLVDIGELSRDDRILRQRLAVLRRERGSLDKINFYDESSHHFRYATAINWNKNILTQRTRDALVAFGARPESVFRPHWLEHPKRALTVFSLILGFGFMSLAWLIRPRAA